MIKKKFIIILVISFLILAFTESYDIKEIEDLDYVIAIGFDKSKKNPDNYSITFQIAKPQDKETGKTTAETLTIDCPTFDIGLSSINNANDKQLNLTHCSSLIISEELAKEGIEPIILNMENNVEIRPTCNLFISKNNAESLINIIGKSPSFSSDIYTNIINSGLSTGYETPTLVYDFYSNMRYNIKDPIAIYVGNTDQKAEPLGLAIFNKDKEIGIISGTEVICHNILSNNLKSATILVPNPFEEEKYFTADISLLKNSKLKVELQDETPIIKCNIYIKARISSSQSTNDDYTSKEQNEAITNSIKDYLSTLLTKYLEKTSKEYNSDIIGFEGILRKKYLTMDEYKNKVNWEKQYPNSKFELNLNIDLDSSYLFQRH